jgi:hypothetical protein
VSNNQRTSRKQRPRPPLPADLPPDAPFEVSRLREAAPWWVFNDQQTWRFIRDGRLGSINVGRRRYLTLALLRAFAASAEVKVYEAREAREARAVTR